MTKVVEVGLRALKQLVKALQVEKAHTLGVNRLKLVILKNVKINREGPKREEIRIERIIKNLESVLTAPFPSTLQNLQL